MKAYSVMSKVTGQSKREPGGAFVHQVSGNVASVTDASVIIRQAFLRNLVASNPDAHLPFIPPTLWATRDGSLVSFELALKSPFISDWDVGSG